MSGNLAQPLDANGQPIRNVGWDATNHGLVIPQVAQKTTDTTGGYDYAPQIMQRAASHKAIAAGAGAAAVVVKASAGELVTVTVTGATSTADLIFYDNASAGSGDILGVIPSGATKGTTVTFNMPAVNGIVAEQANGSAAVTCSFN